MEHLEIVRVDCNMKRRLLILRKTKISNANILQWREEQEYLELSAHISFSIDQQPDKIGPIATHTYFERRLTVLQATGSLDTKGTAVQ